jgi:hypothetical protein
LPKIAIIEKINNNIKIIIIVTHNMETNIETINIPKKPPLTKKKKWS